VELTFRNLGSAADPHVRLTGVGHRTGQTWYAQSRRRTIVVRDADISGFYMTATPLRSIETAACCAKPRSQTTSRHLDRPSPASTLLRMIRSAVSGASYRIH